MSPLFTLFIWLSVLSMLAFLFVLAFIIGLAIMYILRVLIAGGSKLKVLLF